MARATLTRQRAKQAIAMLHVKMSPQLAGHFECRHFELNTTASHAIFPMMIDIKKYRDNAAATAVLLDAGIALMRQNIIRRHPGQTEAEVDAMLSAWLRRDDDSMPGDTAGAVSVRTRES